MIEVAQFDESDPYRLSPVAFTVHRITAIGEASILVREVFLDRSESAELQWTKHLIERESRPLSAEAKCREAPKRRRPEPGESSELDYDPPDPADWWKKGKDPGD